jgi:hypothetical protein
MKKLGLFFILALFALVSQAQTQNTVPLSVIPKIGVNFNDLIISESSLPTISLARLGWNLGVDAKFGKRLQAEGGLHFFKLGTGIETKNDTSHSLEKLTTSQLKIPLGISYKFWNVEYFNLWVHTQVVGNITTKMVQADETTTTKIYPHSGLSGRIGIGMDLSRFSVEVNYERSFTELVRQIFDARSQLISMAIGFRI